MQLATIRSRHYIIYLDDIIRFNLNYIFPGYQVTGSYAIKLNRDADIEIEDEYTGDLVQKIKKQIEKRKVGTPSRFLYQSSMPREMLEYLSVQYQLQPEDMIEGCRYHNLSDFMDFSNPLSPALEELPMPSLDNPWLDREISMLSAISQKDHLLHFPYENYDYVLRFFNEAAIDPM